MSCILGALRNYLCTVTKKSHARLLSTRASITQRWRKEKAALWEDGEKYNAANNGGHYKEAGARRAPTTGDAKCGLAHTGHTREVTDTSPLLTPTLATCQRNVVKWMLGSGLPGQRKS